MQRERGLLELAAPSYLAWSHRPRGRLKLKIGPNRTMAKVTGVARDGAIPSSNSGALSEAKLPGDQADSVAVL